MQAPLQSILLLVLFCHEILLKSEASPEGECLPSTEVYFDKTLGILCSHQNDRVNYHFKEPSTDSGTSGNKDTDEVLQYDIFFSLRNQAENGVGDILCVINKNGSQFFLSIKAGNHSELSDKRNFVARISTSPDTFGTQCSSVPKNLNATSWNKVASDDDYRILRKSFWECNIKNWTLNVATRDDVNEICDLEIVSDQAVHHTGGSLNLNCLYRGNRSAADVYDVEWLYPGCNGTHNTTCQKPALQKSEGMANALRIANLSHDSNGIYRCRVKRRINNMPFIDKPYKVTVVETPAIIHVVNKTEHELHVRENGNVEIIFIANVMPVEDYNSSWSKHRYTVAFDKWDPVPPSSIYKNVVGNTVEERLYLSNCSERTAADYTLNITLGPDFKRTFTWQVIYIADEPSVEVNIYSDPDVDESFILWKGNCTAQCCLSDGIIEDLTMQMRPFGEGPWQDVDAHELKVVKNSGLYYLKWNFVAEKNLEVRCINKTSGQHWQTFANLSGIAEPSIEKSEKGGHILLTCNVPMSDVSEVMWIKGDETLGYEEPVIENYVRKFTIDTSIFHPPWGVFECYTANGELKYEVCKPCTGDFWESSFSRAATTRS